MKNSTAVWGAPYHFPEQLEEISDTYEKLMEEQYVFPEEDLAEDIAKVSRRIENSLANLEKQKLKRSNLKTVKQLIWLIRYMIS